MRLARALGGRGGGSALDQTTGAVIERTGSDAQLLREEGREGERGGERGLVRYCKASGHGAICRSTHQAAAPLTHSSNPISKKRPIPPQSPSINRKQHQAPNTPPHPALALSHPPLLVCITHFINKPPQRKASNIKRRRRGRGGRRGRGMARSVRCSLRRRSARARS